MTIRRNAFFGLEGALLLLFLMGCSNLQENNVWRQAYKQNDPAPTAPIAPTNPQALSGLQPASK